MTKQMRSDVPSGEPELDDTRAKKRESRDFCCGSAS